jgi:hypothetical protein
MNVDPSNLSSRRDSGLSYRRSATFAVIESGASEAISVF